MAIDGRSQSVSNLFGEQLRAIVATCNSLQPVLGGRDDEVEFLAIRESVKPLSHLFAEAIREWLAPGLFHQNDGFSQSPFVYTEAMNAVCWPMALPAMQAFFDRSYHTWNRSAASLAAMLDTTDTRHATVTDPATDAWRDEGFANLTVIGECECCDFSKLSTAMPNHDADTCL